MGACTRLTVELVPSTCWYTNVRSNVSKAVWDRLRRRVATDAGKSCEICGGRGGRWPVECHEVKHAALYLEAVFEQWAARSGHPWTLDITVLERGRHQECARRPERGNWRP